MGSGRIIHMSKASRRTHRNTRPKGRRARRSQARLTLDGGLHLVVATAPTGEVSLEHDLQLVRAALLYADTVEFLSPMAQMVSFTAQLASGDLEVVAATLAQLDAETASDILGETDRDTVLEALTVINQANAVPRAQRRKHLSPEMATELKQATEGMKASLADIETLTSKAGMPELADAIDSGALSLNVDLFDGDTDGLMDRFIDTLKDQLEEPGVHLLLDDEMAGIARGMIAEGLATPSRTGLGRAVRTHAGTRLISHLPAFPDAKVADILEARDELRDPLAAYRSGMKSVEAALTANAFDPELPSEIDELWRDEVDPSIRRLRKDLSTTRVARVAGLNIAEHVKWPAGFSALSFGVIEAFDVANVVTTAATAATFGSGLVSEGVKAYRETQVARDAAHNHDMFYLLKLQDQLAT